MSHLDVGGVVIDDLYGYVEDFCHVFPKDNRSSGYAGNYTKCAVQTTGLHFFNNAPSPSGQQYTGAFEKRASYCLRLIMIFSVRLYYTQQLVED